MVVSTEQGSWIVPPRQGLWVPSGVAHGFHMVGMVITPGPVPRQQVSRLPWLALMLKANKEPKERAKELPR